MEFNERQTIYLQIVDYVEEHILEGAWKEEEKILSVRDLAVELQVNPNTVMRAYEHLQQRGIIQNRRGVGHFIPQEAAARIRQSRRDQFLNQELPTIFRRLSLMEISYEELSDRYHQYIQGVYESKNDIVHEKE